MHVVCFSAIKYIEFVQATRYVRIMYLDECLIGYLKDEYQINDLFRAIARNEYISIELNDERDPKIKDPNPF